MKLCLISNLASHYREEIYRLIDSQLDCDFVFGDTLNNGIKSFDFTGFRNKVQTIKNIQCGSITVWQKSVLKYLFCEYDAFIMTGDIRCFSTWLFLLSAKMLGKTVFLWTHGWYGRETYLKKYLKRIFIACSEGVFLYGNYSKKLMIENGFSPEKLWVIHNSLAYTKQVLIRGRLQYVNVYQKHFSNNDPTILYIGRLTPSKKLEMIVEAMYILQEKSIYCNLVLVGGGPVEYNLRQIVLEKGLKDRVWFYGPCYDEERNAILIYNAEVCVSPGNIGLTAIHSLTFGTPAITHDCFKFQGPEFEAIKPGYTGDFYEFGSVHSLAEKIQEWFAYSCNNRETIRLACYKEIDNYWTPQYQIEVIKKHLI